MWSCASTANGGFSGDDGWLRDVWPGAQRALEYAFTTWDSDGDCVLDSQQHNTYDIEFYGENPLANSIFFAAPAGRRRGSPSTSVRRSSPAAGSSAAEPARPRADAVLYNGEYYRQRIDDVDAHRYQYGEGCLSDQLLGQTSRAPQRSRPPAAARPRPQRGRRDRSQHNFRRDFSDYHNVQRTYALNDEQGLVLCTWPRGGRPRHPLRVQRRGVDAASSTRSPPT